MFTNESIWYRLMRAVLFPRRPRARRAPGAVRPANITIFRAPRQPTNTRSRARGSARSGR